MRRALTIFGYLFFSVNCVAQTPGSAPDFAPDVAPFVSVSATMFVIENVRLVDGTGAEAKEDQAIVVADGKIQWIGPAAAAQKPAGAQVFDRSGYTVIPGLVGMHDHLYYTDSITLQSSSGRLQEPGLFCGGDSVHRSATLPGGRRDDDADDGERGTVCRAESQTTH
jgi:hypothetical protein